MSWIKPHDEGTLLHVHVIPRARRDEICGLHDGALKVRLAAPPVDGKANRRLIRFLSDASGVAPSQIVIVSGQKGRRKTLRLTGVEPDRLVQMLGPLEEA